MQDMKFKVQDESHSRAIQRRLFENGCTWSDGTQRIQHTDMPCLYVEDNLVAHSSNDDGKYYFFNSDKASEGVLTSQGELMLASEYFKQPAAAKQEDKFVEVPEIDAPKPPVGLKPKRVHDIQRMQEILEAMWRYVQAEKCIPAEWFAEAQYLNNLLEQ